MIVHMDNLRFVYTVYTVGLYTYYFDCTISINVSAEKTTFDISLNSQDL